MSEIIASDRFLQPIEVINFFVNETNPRYLATNLELVNYFRPLLMNTSSSFGTENHAFLKEITGRLAVVKKLHGAKYLELKPEFRGKSPYAIYCFLNSEESYGASNVSYENGKKQNKTYETHSKRQTKSFEDLNQILLNEDERRDEREESNEVTKSYETVSKSIGNRVRFTEDTARSRAPISMTLQNELNDASFVAEELTPAPPIPPHFLQTPPPLPPKPLQNIVTRNNEDDDLGRKSSTGFDVNHVDPDTLKADTNNLIGQIYGQPLNDGNNSSLLSNIEKNDTNVENTVDKSDNSSLASENEENDQVFPLPEISASSVSQLKNRGLKRSIVQTASVKDLTRNFDQIVSQQAEECNKLTSNKQVVGGWRWRTTSNSSTSGVEFSTKRPLRNSASSEDFFTYRPLNERGKYWILAGRI